MSEFLRLLLDSIHYLWPFRIVNEWERGNYYVCGRFWRTMPPGLKVAVPFFTELIIETVVRDVYVTRLQTITCKDGSTLTFSATMEVDVVNLGQAYNKVANYSESALEKASAVLAEKLMEVDPKLLDPEKRAYLLSGCLTRLRTELANFGIHVESLRFNNYVRNMRVYRLFNDQSYSSS